jgi:hypothetical protein
MLTGGAADAAGAVSFLDKLYPGEGKTIYEDRARRLANIVVIRSLPPDVFRKAPGAEPIASGPPSAADVG